MWDYKHVILNLDQTHKFPLSFRRGDLSNNRPDSPH